MTPCVPRYICIGSYLEVLHTECFSFQSQIHTYCNRQSHKNILSTKITSKISHFRKINTLWMSFKLKNKGITPIMQIIICT